MIGRKKKEEPEIIRLKEHIDTLHSELVGYSPTEKEYKPIAKAIKQHSDQLSRLQPRKTDKSSIWVAVIGAVTTLTATVAFIRHEEVNVVSSKMTGLIHKPKI
jgi:hypothetical protein